MIFLLEILNFFIKQLEKYFSEKEKNTHIIFHFFLRIYENIDHVKLFLENVKNEKALQYLFYIGTMSQTKSDKFQLLLNDYRIDIFQSYIFDDWFSYEKNKYKNNVIRRKIKWLENVIHDDIKEKTIWINVLIFIKNTIYKIQKYFNLCNFQIDRLTFNIKNYKKQLPNQKELNV